MDRAGAVLVDVAKVAIGLVGDKIRSGRHDRVSVRHHRASTLRLESFGDEPQAEQTLLETFELKVELGVAVGVRRNIAEVFIVALLGVVRIDKQVIGVFREFGSRRRQLERTFDATPRRGRPKQCAQRHCGA